MDKYLEWLKGKKTYVVVAVTFILGGLRACGVEIPEWVYPLLAAAGFGALRAGVRKAEARPTDPSEPDCRTQTRLDVRDVDAKGRAGRRIPVKTKT